MYCRARPSGRTRTASYLGPEGQKILLTAPKPAEGVIAYTFHRMPAAALARLERDLDKLLELTSFSSREAAMRPLAEPCVDDGHPYLATIANRLLAYTISPKITSIERVGNGASMGTAMCGGRTEAKRLPAVRSTLCGGNQAAAEDNLGAGLCLGCADPSH